VKFYYAPNMVYVIYDAVLTAVHLNRILCQVALLCILICTIQWLIGYHLNGRLVQHMAVWPQACCFVCTPALSVTTAPLRR